MTADQRLDQLEPLVSQTLAVVDRHTAQLKQLVSLVLQQGDLARQQSDNIVFAINEIKGLRQEIGEVSREVGGVRQEIGEVSREVGGVRQEIGGVSREVGGVRQEVGGVRQEVLQEIDELKGKIDAIEQNQSIANTRLGDVENAVSIVGIKVTNLDTKLDQILGLLDGGK